MSAPTTPLALLAWRSLGAEYPGGGFAADDAATDWATSRILTALTSVGEEAFYAFTDDAWLDPARTPDSFVITRAQIAGVDTKGVDLATLRQWISNGGPTRQRGTDAAMELRVMQVLTGTKSIRFYPRTDPDNPGVDSPGHTLIFTLSSETPGGATSVVAAARDRAAAVWQLVHSVVGVPWDVEAGRHTTWTAAATAHSTWQDMAEGLS